ncbi:hypothetical protein [Deinococcus sp.]|uniref:hypothetical protein n=1 Tax=Deinococcus sp. TaxID=47478 RepID=UPI003B5AAA51
MNEPPSAGQLDGRWAGRVATSKLRRSGEVKARPVFGVQQNSDMSGGEEPPC